jgi:transcriptional regulator with XRE-family HTH domain
MPFLGSQAKSSKIAIGGKIKSRRKELRLTLAGLAEASGLSAPFLSQAERNQTVPSLVSLAALAKALQVEVGYFMEVPKDDNIVRRADEPELIDLDSPVVYHQLSSSLPGQMMDAIMMTIPPGHRFPIDQREGEDFLFVVDGEIVSRWAIFAPCCARAIARTSGRSPRTPPGTSPSSRWCSSMSARHPSSATSPSGKTDRGGQGPNLVR